MLHQTFSKRLPAGWIETKNTGDEIILKRLPLLPVLAPESGLVEIKLRPRSQRNERGNSILVYYYDQAEQACVRYKTVRYLGMKESYPQWGSLEKGAVDFMSKVNKNLSVFRRKHLSFSVKNIIERQRKAGVTEMGLREAVEQETGVSIPAYNPSLYQTVIKGGGAWHMHSIFPLGTQMPNTFQSYRKGNRIELLSDWHPVKDMPQVLDTHIVSKILPELSSLIR